MLLLALMDRRQDFLLIGLATSLSIFVSSIVSYFVWMGLAEAISKVTTPIFLSVLYFIVVTPAGLVMRLFGRKPLRHGGPAGFWVARAGAGRGTMHNQF